MDTFRLETNVVVDKFIILHASVRTLIGTGLLTDTEAHNIDLF